MAVTRIIPIRGSKGQSVIRSLTERTDYVKNPEKTEKGSLVYAYGCTPQLVAGLSSHSRSGNMRCVRDAESRGLLHTTYGNRLSPARSRPKKQTSLAASGLNASSRGVAYIVCTHTDRRHHT